MNDIFKSEKYEVFVKDQMQCLDACQDCEGVLEEDLDFCKNCELLQDDFQIRLEEG